MTREESGWIPCNKKLPTKEDGEVLITIQGWDGYKVRTGRYLEENKMWLIGDLYGTSRDEPIAWMKKPEPYRGAFYEYISEVCNNITGEIQKAIKEAMAEQISKEDADKDPTVKDKIINAIINHGVCKKDINGKWETVVNVFDTVHIIENYMEGGKDE